MIGQTVSHYKVLEKLGEGGMGIVYKAEDLKLKRIVALKFLPSGGGQTPEELARFHQEAEALSALNHPNIATIFDIEEVDGQRFLALEFISGGTLKSLLKQRAGSNTHFSVKEIVSYGAQVAEALAHAHKAGIVHRDVKSDNVMLTSDGNVKLTDFGLAKLRKDSQLTQAGSTLGTAAYMSPEQVRGEEVDGRSDIFSLGVVLFELATLHLPFKGEHPVALAYSIANEEPMEIAEWRPDLAPSLTAIIKKCLQKELSNRFQSVSEIAAALRNVETASSSSAAGMQMPPAPAQQRRFGLKFGIVAIILLAVAWGLFTIARRPAEAAANMKTVAVLPFSNMSNNPDDEYFTDGVMEDILADLSKIRDLNVISRTTMMQYKDSKKSLREIGNELNAGVVLQGSVRHAGGNVRIVAELIDASTDKNVWGETYDRAFQDIFAIQSDVAKNVAIALKATLSLSEKASIEKKPTENVEAYNLYLKGNYLIQKATQAEIDEGYRLMCDASKLDSTFALPYIGIAMYYNLATDFYLAPNIAMPQVKAAMEKAIQIDPGLSEAHVQLGMYDLWYKWDWNSAGLEFARAIELNPKDELGHFFNGWYFSSQGNFDQGMKELKTFTELDPISPLGIWSSLNLYHQHRYNEALRSLEMEGKVDPNFAFTPMFRGLFLLAQKNYPEGIAEVRKSHSQFSSPWTLARLGYAYAVAGQRDEARKILDTLREQARTMYVPSDIVASIYVGLEDRDKAFEYLTKAYDERAGWMIWIKNDPIWDAIRSDARFVALLKKMNLG